MPAVSPLRRGHSECNSAVRHYNQDRPHRALGLQPSDQPAGLTVDAEDQQARVRRRDLLGGLLHE
jgi:transposase InsO family protein